MLKNNANSVLILNNADRAQPPQKKRICSDNVRWCDTVKIDLYYLRTQSVLKNQMYEKDFLVQKCTKRGKNW